MANDLQLPEVTTLHPDVLPERHADVALRDACAELIEADAEVRRLEQQLDAAKARLDRARLVDVPEAMRAAGVERCGDVALEHQLHCSTIASERKNVWAWMKSLGASDLLTCTMSVSFARNEYALAREFAKRAAVCLSPEKPRLVVEEWSCHPQTLKGFIGHKFFVPGKLAEIHPGVRYFNQNVAVITTTPTSAEAAEENPLG